MGRKTIVIALILVSALSAGSPANFPWRQNPSQMAKLTNNFAVTPIVFVTADTSVGELLNQKKSPALAMGMSLIIPGTGQLYNKSYWRAGLYAGIEILSWTMVAIYNSKGQEKDSEFKAYANAHWSEPVYWAKVYQLAINDPGRVPQFNYDFGWDVNEVSSPGVFPGWISTGFIPEYEINTAFRDDLREIETLVAQRFTHRLPATHTQQYYEMIGKYSSQFGTAWDDADFNKIYNGYNGDLTQNNADYFDMRNESNDYYDIATSWMSVILVNHLISSLDALITTKKHNKSLEVGYMPRFIDGDLVSTYTVKMNF